jgi:hypothetical protein
VTARARFLLGVLVLLLMVVVAGGDRVRTHKPCHDGSCMQVAP